MPYHTHVQLFAAFIFHHWRLWSEGPGFSRNSQKQRSKCNTVKRHDKTWVTFPMLPKRTKTSSYTPEIITTAKIPVCLHTFNFYIMSHEGSVFEKQKQQINEKNNSASHTWGNTSPRPHAGLVQQREVKSFLDGFVRAAGFENTRPRARQPGGEAGGSRSVQCRVGRK